MRFYFDFLSHDNDEILDCEGVELVDWLGRPSPRRPDCLLTVPFIPEGPDGRGWRIQVTDESRKHVLSVLVHALSRDAASGLTQQTNVPDLTAIPRGGEAGWRPEPSLRLGGLRGCNGWTDPATPPNGRHSHGRPFFAATRHARVLGCAVGLLVGVFGPPAVVGDLGSCPASSIAAQLPLHRRQ